ncbi:gp16 family phage-associated protein [Sphingomonas zeicaulis]|uniref:hypothetical protein n=1 Tax=Sphingomonas zeicaulis TaxID=1632740 RepID=UPI003D23A4AE
MRRTLDPRAVTAQRQRMVRTGMSYADLAREIGHVGDESLLRDILTGRRACLRGKSHAIATKLGLKTAPLNVIADND